MYKAVAERADKYADSELIFFGAGCVGTGFLRVCNSQLHCTVTGDTTPDSSQSHSCVYLELDLYFRELLSQASSDPEH